jgi:triosephosphate isomerase (TIM)
VADAARRAGRVDVVLCPPFTAIAAAAQELWEAKSAVMLGAQNMHHEIAGAFTGEVSAPMLKDSGATWVILGHSERRQHFGETDDGVARKVAAAIRAELRPIACVGETLEERDAGRTLEVVERQVRAFLEELAKNPGFGVIAYEPVWAIGTGKVARPEDAQEVHATIRGLLASMSDELAASTRILYGGSMKADNAEGLLAQVDVDGGLVGGASLDASGFGKIIESAERLAEAAEQG